MEKYLLQWRLNSSLIPADVQERASVWGKFMEMTKQDINKGLLKDWGGFCGESQGYCILEGSKLDLMKVTQKYVPFVEFEVHPVVSIDDLGELLRSMQR